MILKSKPRIEQLDQFLAERDYTSALEAITEEIKHRPENFNLLLRQAEILGQAGDRDKAIEVYRKLAKHYAEQGFYARAIAVTKKVLSLDPKRSEVNQELADLISAQREAEEELHPRHKLRTPADAKSALSAPKPAAPAPPVATPAAAPPATEQLRVPVAAPASMPEPFPAEPELLPPPPLPLQPVDAAQVEPETRPPLADMDTPPSGVRLDVEPAPEQADREREASRFFSDFPRGALEELLSSTSVRSFLPQEVIVQEGEPGTSLFLIEDGTVQVLTFDPAKRPLVLAHLGAGEFFGEVAVLTGRPRTATIVAQTPVTAIEITREDLDHIAARFPEVKDVLRRFYERRARATVEAMLSRLRGKRG
jgi:Cyclic nucleotide-binding domain